MAVSSIVEMVPVHYAGKSTRGKAAFFVTRETARDYVEAFLAEWDKKVRAITLKRSEATPAGAAQSLTMGPDVIEGNADGNPHHVAMVQEWGWLR